MTGVTVQAVTVLPASASVLESESVQLAAEVRDEEGRLLETAEVTWSSDRPGILSVSPTGLVSALGAGFATVTASFGDVYGSASVTVTPLALLRIDPQSLVLRGALGSVATRPLELEIQNAGSQPVKELKASVAYPSGAPSGWLEARLEAPQSPTTAEVVARTADLTAGEYEATILIWGREAETPVMVPVELTVAGLQVRETGGATLIRSSDETDHIEVALLLRPEGDVVLEVESADPGIATVSPQTLRFTSDSWNEPQTLTVAAGDRSSGWFWGFDETEVSIAVDTSRSDPRYGPVEESRVSVSVLRRIFGLQVTGGEEGTRW